jgi:type II secretory pathway component GspD/PulD (secretin)
VTLRIRPNITPENAVDTTIYLEISTVESELINGQIATNTLDMTTNIIVDDGETVMLGGILFQTDATVHQKVPFLGDIPLIGGLFNHDRQIMRNSELLIFVTPYVIDGAQTKPATIEFLDDAHARMTDVTLEVNELLEALEEETQIDKSTEVPDGQDEISTVPEPAIADSQAD